MKDNENWPFKPIEEIKKINLQTPEFRKQFNEKLAKEGEIVRSSKRISVADMQKIVFY